MNVFSVIVGIGASLGMLGVVWRAPQKLVIRSLDNSLWVLVGALIGGRAAYVMASWPYIRDNLLEIPQVWLGGLSGPGALWGALVGLVCVSGFTRQPLGWVADGLFPLAAPLVVSAWLACWWDGSAYGPPTSAWWGFPAVDEWGVLTPRWPTQLLGALAALAWLWLLDWKRGLFNSPGQLASLALLGLSLELFGISFLRADPSQVWSGLRQESWMWLAMAGTTWLAFLASILLRPAGLRKASE